MFRLWKTYLTVTLYQMRPCIFALVVCLLYSRAHKTLTDIANQATLGVTKALVWCGTLSPYLKNCTTLLRPGSSTFLWHSIALLNFLPLTYHHFVTQKTEMKGKGIFLTYATRNGLSPGFTKEERTGQVKRKVGEWHMAYHNFELGMNHSYPLIWVKGSHCGR